MIELFAPRLQEEFWELDEDDQEYIVNEINRCFDWSTAEVEEMEDYFRWLIKKGRLIR